jgi:hypothetical protein
MDYNKFENNLGILLKLFNNRPNHLTKYLIDNDCFTQKFKNLILKSDKLNNTLFSESNDLDFNNYEEMHSYFDKLINEVSNDQVEPDPELVKELNNQLFSLLTKEKYEDAVQLRDYMLKRKIRIII